VDGLGTVPRALRLAIERRGLTITAAADRAHMDRSRLSRYLCGRIDLPTEEFVRVLRVVGLETFRTALDEQGGLDGQRRSRL
jgi:transcriptional regulator with XRE-family HTH domain